MQTCRFGAGTAEGAVRVRSVRCRKRTLAGARADKAYDTPNPPLCLARARKQPFSGSGPNAHEPYRIFRQRRNIPPHRHFSLKNSQKYANLYVHLCIYDTNFKKIEIFC